MKKSYHIKWSARHTLVILSQGSLQFTSLGFCYFLSSRNFHEEIKITLRKAVNIHIKNNNVPAIIYNLYYNHNYTARVTPYDHLPQKKAAQEALSLTFQDRINQNKHIT